MNKRLLYLLLLPAFLLTACKDDEIESLASAEEVRPFTGVYKGKMTTYIEDMETSRVWQQVKVETLGDTIALTMEAFRVKDVYFGDLVLKGIQARRDGDVLTFHAIANLPLRGISEANVETEGTIEGGELTISYAIKSVKTPSVYARMDATKRDRVESDSAAIVSMSFTEGLVLVQPEIDQEYKTVRFYVADSLSDSTRVVLRPEIGLFEGGTCSPASGDSLDFSYGRHAVITVWAEDSIHRTDYYVYMAKVRSYPLDFETWQIQPLNEKDSLLTYLEPFGWSTSNGWIRWSKMNDNFYSKEAAYPVERITKAYAGKYAAQITTLAMAGNDTMPYLHGGVLLMGSYSANPSDPAMNASYGGTFDTRPVNVTGWYKYKPGAMYYENNTEIPGGVDTCCVRAVLYEVGSITETLNSVQLWDDSRIIAAGTFQTTEKVLEYTSFTLKLEYLRDFITNRKYKLAVAFFSSKHGEKWIGAPGSVLTVDEVNIVAR